MNTNNDTDDRIRDVYRDTKDMTAPAALNRAVLLEARRAVKPAPVLAPGWLRPLAFAATLALGVALLFEMQAVTPLPGAAPSADEATLQTAPASGRPADAPVQDLASEEQAKNLSVQKFRDNAELPAASMAAEALNPVLPAAQASPDGNRQAQQKVGETQDMDTAADSFASGFRHEQEPVPANDREYEQREEMPARLRESSQDRAVPATRLEATRMTSGEHERTAIPEHKLQAATPCDDTLPADEWWQCIVQLREAGQSAVADAELARFRAQYPDFTAPE